MNDKYPYKYKNILSVYCDVSNLGRAILLKRSYRQRTAKKRLHNAIHSESGFPGRSDPEQVNF